MSAPHTYQYHVNNASRETNQFGVDALREAIRNGYSQGYRAGKADRADHWHFDFANSPAYQEATFGYSGSYVDLADYSYYFRQGFERGYNDGYYKRPNMARSRTASGRFSQTCSEAFFS